MWNSTFMIRSLQTSLDDHSPFLWSEEALLSYRRKDLISHQVEPGWQLHTMLFRRSYIRTFHRIHTIIRLPKRLWKDISGCSCCAVFFCRSVASFLPQLFSFEDGTLWLLYLREPKDDLTQKTSIFYRSSLSGQPRILTEGGFEPGTWRFGPQTSLALDH